MEIRTIPAALNRNFVEAEALGEHIGRQVRICGSVYKLRRMSGFAFVLLRTGRSVVQCVYCKEDCAFPLEALAEESCVAVTADVAAEPRSRAGYELKIREIEVLCAPASPPPVVINQKRVDTSLDHLLDARAATLRNERERAIFLVQAGLCEGLRAFLSRERFTEVHTPKIVASGAEGGANIFHLDYFGRAACLAQSPQLYKQMLVGVFGRVYEIGPVFRAEKHDTSRHLNEYTSVDLEMGYIEGFEELMRLETAMLSGALQSVAEACGPEISLLGASIPQIEGIPAVRFGEAKAWVARALGRGVRDPMDLEPEEERTLCELVQRETGSEFVFVTRYPSAKRPFYAMDDPENPAETLSFDLLFRGMEITTGGQRIHDYARQVEKLERRGMDASQFADYLAAHRCGLPPHGGLGLGLERLTARLLGLENVRRAALFPRDAGRVTP